MYEDQLGELAYNRTSLKELNKNTHQWKLIKININIQILKLTHYNYNVSKFNSFSK